MAAQPGSALVLSYGPQGARQPGAAVVLQTAPPVVPRVRVSCGVRAPWARAAELSAPVRVAMVATVSRAVPTRAHWVPRQPVQRSAAPGWVIGLQANHGRTAPWQYLGAALQRAAQGPWVPALQSDRAALLPWIVLPVRAHAQAAGPWQRVAATDRPALAPWQPRRALGATTLRAPTAAARHLGIVQWVPWTRISRPLSPGWGVPSPGAPLPDAAGTYIVPTLRLYLMQNEISLTRVSDGAALPALSLSLGLDAGSWAWRAQASLPASALPLVESTGEPVELQAVVNGQPVRWLVESIARERSFGAEQIRISGRSPSALLAAPYAAPQQRSNTTARTAQQLMGDVLSINGVPMAWLVDWQITDWLVPAGAWSHQGSYIDALTTIAAAAGAYLQPHPTDRTLRVLPQYPVAPWAWAATAPAFELPAAVTQRESIEWQRRPDYNRVFVSGTTHGVLGQITRAGTAGDLVAPLITDPLATAADAVRQRGLAVLADVGRQARVVLTLPVLEQTGVIQPGALIRYVDGATTRRGLVRAVAVDANLTQVTQRLDVETHP